MKRNIVQLLLGLALLAIVVQAALLAPRIVRDNQPEAPAEKQQTLNNTQGVDQSLGGMHMIETQKGTREWELWSEKAERHKEKDLLKLQTVKAVFFAASGVTFTVTGREGTVEVKTKDMRIDGNVITKSSNGYTFKTQSMNYESSKKTLTTSSAIEMLGPSDEKGSGLNLKGRGMKAQMEKGSMEVLSDVRGEKVLKNGRHFFIKSHRALFSSHDRTGRFFEDVVLDLETMRITGPEAQFDYDKDSSEIRSLKVKGGAKVSDTDKFATANNLDVDFDTNKFIFSGEPRVVQNNDELKGERIVFLDGGKRVQVLRARAKVDETLLEKKN